MLLSQLIFPGHVTIDAVNKWACHYTTNILVGQNRNKINSFLQISQYLNQAFEKQLLNIEIKGIVQFYLLEISLRLNLVHACNSQPCIKVTLLSFCSKDKVLFNYSYVRYSNTV